MECITHSGFSNLRTFKQECLVDLLWLFCVINAKKTKFITDAKMVLCDYVTEVR